MVKIEIKTGNATFSDGNDGIEIARILNKVAKQFSDGYMSVKYGCTTEANLSDINGNKIGKCEYRNDSEPENEDEY